MQFLLPHFLLVALVRMDPAYGVSLEDVSRLDLLADSARARSLSGSAQIGGGTIRIVRRASAQNPSASLPSTSRSTPRKQAGATTSSPGRPELVKPSRPGSSSSSKGGGTVRYSGSGRPRPVESSSSSKKGVLGAPPATKPVFAKKANARTSTASTSAVPKVTKAGPPSSTKTVPRQKEIAGPSQVTPKLARTSSMSSLSSIGSHEASPKSIKSQPSPPKAHPRARMAHLVSAPEGLKENWFSKTRTPTSVIKDSTKQVRNPANAGTQGPKSYGLSTAYEGKKPRVRNPGYWARREAAKAAAYTVKKIDRSFS